MSLTLIRRIQLHCYQPENNHDKIYELRIKKDNASYVVEFSYGRRGTRLKEGVKGIYQQLNDAERIYQIILNEKTAKGYRVVSEDRQEQVQATIYRRRMEQAKVDAEYQRQRAEDDVPIFQGAASASKVETLCLTGARRKFLFSRTL